jgi:hypothetical protein
MILVCLRLFTIQKSNHKKCLNEHPGNEFIVWKFYCALTLFLEILDWWPTAFKIHDFLPQNTGITYFSCLFFGDIFKQVIFYPLKKKKDYGKKGC